MAELTKIERANLASMVAKLKAGSVLTESEERRLREYEERQSHGEQSQPSTTEGEAAAQPSGFVNSWDEVSARLGTTARQWVTYSRRAGVPAKTEKGYDLAALAAWKVENVGHKSDATLKAAKAEKLAEEIALLRIRRAKEERKFVNIDGVNELHRTMALKLRALLYSKLENEMPPK